MKTLVIITVIIVLGLFITFIAMSFCRAASKADNIIEESLKEKEAENENK